MGVLMRQFLRNESGAAVYEFTLIAALVSAAILASVIALGVKLDTAHGILLGKAASPV
jgi:Flp pilus assembly pilin Flp